ncbi:RibD family protein [Salinisphaera sp. SPP-AMP-43]|uniref:RibD family protein n=1 Tax=Salinisphaera sp. SPP-AMP-43 TaxID=3121288 RepID=UPI003C6E9D6A
MPVIDADYAWRLIRDAREQPTDAPWHPCEGLVIQPGGAWLAEIAVDDEAADLFDMLLPIAFSAPRLVVAQLGQSLDGRIATASGHSYYVTGEASRIHLHRLRALVDAVVVGAGTVAADDPQLTVRHVDGTQPKRVVLDPNARVPADCGLFSDSGPETLHGVREAGRAAPGATPLVLPDVSAAALPSTLLALLAERGLQRVLIEGGGVTISHFINANRVDRLHTVVAPMLIGSGRPGLLLDEIETLDQARRPKTRSFVLGDDRLYDLELNPRA